MTIIPVHHEKHLAYAQEIQKLADLNGFRCKIDARNEKLGYRIREAQTKKIPLQIVIGDGEEVVQRQVYLQAAHLHLFSQFFRERI